VVPNKLWHWIIFFAILAGWIIFFSVAEGYNIFINRSAKQQGKSAVTTPGDDDKTDHKYAAVENRISQSMALSRDSKSNFISYTFESLDEAVVDGALLVVANGKYVYDISNWINSHPGGQIILYSVIGTDITSDYFLEAGYGF
jgi:cytochrome b involved in lipid metabolism